MNLKILVEKKPYFTGSVTGYKLYYTNDSSQTNEEYEKWMHQEALSNQNSYNFVIDANKHEIVSGDVYRVRATVFFNNVESVPTGVISINTRQSIPKAPLIVNTKILYNSSVLISFVPADDVNAIEVSMDL